MMFSKQNPKPFKHSELDIKGMYHWNENFAVAVKIENFPNDAMGFHSNPSKEKHWSVVVS